ncbi:MAG: AI-2E family transporter [Pelagibacteraceae bacterium]|jgi:AI-2 transport protein TqsA|nr:AI-2E family transporter [Pelagibacteraceae bacterium]HJL57825.1 AI-2E family transporter [Alphaproteobacteria bacterium]MBO6467081.1 AI-2E family transporter [Pelagibacteraceae bacterium]MBO6467240.1 AI-2E family transporter [Pelagibacteraceae bacterium]MBO6470010.1 AI-2E family transporter [Pelagibacteraceae bacterium]|tara:strand:- start:932 stop:1951 length:1020 start_codon:yes stop_codon:yes gene_type:complete
MPKEFREQNQILTFSVLIMAIIASAFAFYYARTVLIPFVLAMLLKTLITPIIEFQINKLRVYRLVAVPIAIVIVVCFFIIILPPLFNSIRSFLLNASDYQDRVIIFIDFILRWIQEKTNIDLDIMLIEESIKDLPFLDWTSELLGHTAHFFETFFIILVILLFLVIGDSNKKKTQIWHEIDHSVKKYISTKFIIASGTAVIFGLTYWFLELELALVFASLTFFLSFIPVFGAVIAVILPIPVAFIQYTSATPIILIILIPTIAKFIIGDFIEPKLIGSALKLHPVTIILSLIFWGILWGVVGVFLAAPITAIIKISFEKFDTTLPFARLLEGNIHHLRD